MKKWIFVILFLAAISFLCLPRYAKSQHEQMPKHGAGSAVSSGKPADYPAMPGPGKKVSVGKEYYFVYGFDKKPKLGTMIMKVELYTPDGKKETSLEVKADSGMPSMRGAHESGDRAFKLSKNGAYLLPIDIVMPGGWEIRFTILKEGNVIFRGSYQFDV
jgi:hypothetical protein